jgi:hypothetical protein
MKRKRKKELAGVACYAVSALLDRPMFGALSRSHMEADVDCRADTADESRQLLPPDIAVG